MEFINNNEDNPSRNRVVFDEYGDIKKNLNAENYGTPTARSLPVYKDYYWSDLNERSRNSLQDDEDEEDFDEAIKNISQQTSVPSKSPPFDWSGNSNYAFFHFLNYFIWDRGRTMPNTWKSFADKFIANNTLRAYRGYSSVNCKNIEDFKKIITGQTKERSLQTLRTKEYQEKEFHSAGRSFSLNPLYSSTFFTQNTMSKSRTTNQEGVFIVCNIDKNSVQGWGHDSVSGIFNEAEIIASPDTKVNVVKGFAYGKGLDFKEASQFDIVKYGLHCHDIYFFKYPTKKGLFITYPDKIYPLIWPTKVKPIFEYVRKVMIRKDYAMSEIGYKWYEVG